MIPVALLLLLLGGSRVELVDEVYAIPGAEWRYVELGLKQLPVTVLCDYEVESGSPQVRVALLRRADMERLRRDQSHGVMAITERGTRGRIRYHLRTAGDFAVVVDNRSAEQQGARVHLRISLDFEGPPGPAVTYVPENRRLAVILISFAVFFGIVTWSAKKLLAAVRR